MRDGINIAVSALARTKLAAVAISRFLEDTTQNPTPFSWSTDPDTTIAAVRHGHQRLDLIHYISPRSRRLV